MSENTPEPVVEEPAATESELDDERTFDDAMSDADESETDNPSAVAGRVDESGDDEADETDETDAESADDEA